MKPFTNALILTVLITLGLQLATRNCYAQVPAIQWQKSYGGTLNDQPNCVRQTRDGGYIVAGGAVSDDGDVTGHHGKATHGDYWIIKLDDTGIIRWKKSLGGSYNDGATCIEQTKDGGYIVGGNSQSSDGNVTGHHGDSTQYDCWIVKLDSAGNIQWQKSLGGTNDDQTNSVRQTSDGGYIVAGSSASLDGDVTGNHGKEDMWIVKLDSTGTIAWQKSYGGSDYDYSSCIRITKDGGYIVAGISISNDGDVSGHHGGENYDYWIVKLDSIGNLQWQKSMGGTSYDQVISIQLTKDGGYIANGFTGSNDGDVSGNHGGNDCWVVKMDSTGNIQWQKCYGGSQFDDGREIIETKDGGYLLSGIVSSDDGDVTGFKGVFDGWLAKTDSAGLIQWQKCYGGSHYDAIFGVQQTTDGGFIFAASSASADGDVTSNQGAYDYWIVKLAPDISTEVKESEIISNELNVYPNPANDIITIKTPSSQLNATYSITDIAGRKILTGQLQSTINTIAIDKLGAGMYLLQVGDEVKLTFKVVKE